MSAARTYTIDSLDHSLYVRELGSPEAQPVVMLHGMRDVAMSLWPIAERLADHYRVILPDLRGHGRSTRSGVYSLDAYLFDLHQLAEVLELDSFGLFGHSLGGQIATRFAALFPQYVAVLAVAEGLGPPRYRKDLRKGNSAGQRLIQVFKAATRPLPDLAFARERLMRGNPRLPRARVDEILPHITETDANGVLNWAFDPRVQAVFLPGEDGYQYWPQVRCPTLIIGGEQAGEYWARAIAPEDNWDGNFAPRELEERAAIFPHHRLVMLPNSGHMVHFDEPEQVSEATIDYFQDYWTA